MSFGFGVGDFLLILDRCRDVCSTIKGAPGEYRECQSELQSVTAAIESLVKSADDRDSRLSRQGAYRKEDLVNIVNNFRRPLDDLQALVNHHSRIVDNGSGRLVRVWESFRFGQSDLDAIRSKLNFHLLTINTFMVSLEGFSMSSMERKLDKIYAMLKTSTAGAALEFNSCGASIVSTKSSIILSEIDIEGEEAWQGLKEALVDEDISLQQIVAHRDNIFHYVKGLISNDSTFEATIALGGLAQTTPEISVAPEVNTINFAESDSGPTHQQTDFLGLGITAYDRPTFEVSPQQELRPVVLKHEIRNSSSDSASGQTLLPHISNHALPKTVAPSSLEDKTTPQNDSVLPEIGDLQVDKGDTTSRPLMYRSQARTPEETSSILVSPSRTSRSSSVFDTDHTLASTVTTPMSSPATSRSPTLVAPTPRTLSARTSIAVDKGSISAVKIGPAQPFTKQSKKKKSSGEKKLSWASRFADSFKPATTPTAGSVYNNPYAGLY